MEDKKRAAVLVKEYGKIAYRVLKNTISNWEPDEEYTSDGEFKFEIAQEFSDDMRNLTALSKEEIKVLFEISFDCFKEEQRDINEAIMNESLRKEKTVYDEMPF